MTTATRKRNPYRVPRGFVPNPFTPLYQEPDVDPSEDLSVQEILDYALTLEDQVPGDFNLSQVVNEIKSNCLSFVRTGLLAYKVKVYKIYLNVHRNFKEFCEKALGVSHWQINRTIEAARVVIELAQNGFDILPKCEAQCRPLTKFSGAALCANWQSVLDTTLPHRITGRAINEALGIETTSGSVQFSPEFYKFLKEQAASAGMSIEQLLKAWIDYCPEVKEVAEEKLRLWEEDLQELVSTQLENTSQTEAVDNTSKTETFPDSPASDEPPLQPGLHTAPSRLDQETSSVVINVFGLQGGCQAQPGLLTNLYGTESCANWPSFSNTTPVEWCANWPSFQDTTPVRKITGNTINEVLGMEKEYEVVTFSEDFHDWIQQKALSAGMSIEDYLEVASGFRQVEQAAQKKPNLFQKRRATKQKARSKRGFG